MQSNGSAFAGLQPHLAKGTQLLLRAQGAPGRILYIQLHHLRTGAGAGVGDGAGHRQIAASVHAAADFWIVICKGGVRQPMAKGKAHRHVEFVIVPIAYIQALSVGHPVAAGGELAVAGRVFHGVGEALGQLAAGAALPSEQMGAGLCGALACQIQVENGTHP